MKDMPAFPSIHSEWLGKGYTNIPGLTKREYIATAALQGLLARPGLQCTREQFASESVKYADALLAELSRKKSHEV